MTDESYTLLETIIRLTYKKRIVPNISGKAHVELKYVFFQGKWIRIMALDSPVLVMGSMSIW